MTAVAPPSWWVEPDTHEDRRRFWRLPPTDRNAVAADSYSRHQRGVRPVASCWGRALDRLADDRAVGS